MKDRRPLTLTAFVGALLAPDARRARAQRIGPGQNVHATILPGGDTQVTWYDMARNKSATRS
jgi:hypothetical protein